MHERTPTRTRGGETKLADTRIELADETWLLIHNLLREWIDAQEALTREIPRTAMRDWHRISIKVGYDR